MKQVLSVRGSEFQQNKESINQEKVLTTIWIQIRELGIRSETRVPTFQCLRFSPEMNKGISFLATICLVLSLATIASAHGSHSHNKNEHKHFNPKESVHDSILKDERLVQDREHLKEELPEHLTEEDIDKMTPQELEYHYFRTHDLDKNNRLDGLEVMNAIFHIVQHPEYPYEMMPAHEREAERQKRIERFHKDIQELEILVDETMKTQDLNKDGYITYYEYMRARSLTN